MPSRQKRYGSTRKKQYMLNNEPSFLAPSVGKNEFCNNIDVVSSLGKSGKNVCSLMDMSTNLSVFLSHRTSVC